MQDFKKRLEVAVEKYKELGATNVSFSKYLREDRQDSIWHNGDVVFSFDYLGHEFYVKAIGDIRIEVLDKNGEQVEFLVDKNNAGIEPESFTNDMELNSLIVSELLTMHSGNWFELMSYTNPQAMISSESIFGDLEELIDDVESVLELSKYMSEM